MLGLNYALGIISKTGIGVDITLSQKNIVNFCGYQNGMLERFLSPQSLPTQNLFLLTVLLQFHTFKYEGKLI